MKNVVLHQGVQHLKHIKLMSLNAKAAAFVQESVQSKPLLEIKVYLTK
jgi:hypothetical protein